MFNYQIQKSLNHLFPGVGAVVNGDSDSENFFIKLDDKNLEIPSLEQLEAAWKIVALEQAKKDKYTEILSQLSFINVSQTMGELLDVVSLSKNDILNICIAIRDKDSPLYLKARTIKDEILALTTVEEVNNYEINFEEE